MLLILVFCEFLNIYLAWMERFYNTRFVKSIDLILREDSWGGDHLPPSNKTVLSRGDIKSFSAKLAHLCHQNINDEYTWQQNPRTRESSVTWHFRKQPILKEITPCWYGHSRTLELEWHPSYFVSRNRQWKTPNTYKTSHKT